MRHFAVKLFIASFVFSCVIAFLTTDVIDRPGYYSIDEATSIEDVIEMASMDQKRTVFKKFLDKAAFFSDFQLFKFLARVILSIFPFVFIVALSSVFMYHRHLLRKNKFSNVK